mgnify:CR=1 FL=1
MNVVAQHLADAMAIDELERQMRFRRAWEAYHGQGPRPLKTLPGKVDDNVRVNYAKLIVNKGVSFLFGQDVTFELDETRQTAAEQWLQACWDELGGMLLLQKLALNGGVCGHAWAKLAPAPQGMLYPRVIVLDPANVSVGLALDDIERVEWYRIQYTAVDPRNGEPVTRRQWIERDGPQWLIVDEESRKGGAWRRLGETPWPYAWAPIIDCQNLPLPNEYWGASDLEDDVLELSRSIDFVLSNTARIIRFHAHPKTWARGVHGSDLKVGVDEMILLQSENGELHNLEMQSDLGSSIAFYERLREALHEVSQVPEVATGKLEGIGALSGLALQILYQPLMEKTEVKRRTYGGLLVELNRRLLEMGGWGPDQRTVLHWPAMLPTDPMAERQVAVLDEQLGVSRDTLLQQLGYDPDLEREKRGVQEAETMARLIDEIEHGPAVEEQEEQ